jgi:hypothetical protein
MRVSALIGLLTLVSVSPAAAQMTTLERQRLLAHLEMTASLLVDELDGLSPAQLEFRAAADSWTILQVLDHLVVVGDIYWEDLQKGVKTPLNGRTRRNSDADLLWYGIDRSDREVALPSEVPRGTIRSAPEGLQSYRRQHARLVEYIRATRDDLRNRYVERQRSDAYQWALLISTHVQRHILQMRAIKAAPGFPSKS